MSRTPAAEPQPDTPSRDRLAPPSHAQPVGRERGRRRRRGLVRAAGVLMVVATAGLLLVHRSLSSSTPVGDPALRASLATKPATITAESQKLAVCFGYADLEGGVTDLHPSQTGRVAEVLVKENDTVLANAPLLRLDDRAAQYKVEEARATLDEALARLSKAEKGPEQHRHRVAEQRAALMTARYRRSAAEHTLAARRAQMKSEAIGRKREDPVTTEEVASTADRIKEFEEVENSEQSRLRALESQDPAVEIARVRAEVATMRARLHEAEQVLEEHTLRAPEEGKVLRIFVTPGELLSAPPKKMAIQFCPNRPRIIRAEVDQAFAAKVEVGLPAVVEDDGVSGLTWRGKVMRTSDWYTQRRQIADEQLSLKDVRTLECLIGLDPGQSPLRIGQRVRVTINRAGPER